MRSLEKRLAKLEQRRHDRQHRLRLNARQGMTRLYTMLAAHLQSRGGSIPGWLADRQRQVASMTEDQAEALREDLWDKIGPAVIARQARIEREKHGWA
ncbi:MAG: hypothetical protein ACYC0Y_25565 [Pirellulales bacterium]